MRFGHYTVFDTPEENKHTQVYVEYDVPNNDDLEGATGTIVLTEGGQGSGGGGDAGNGIRSISISPAITTDPALESFFPIYWKDLTAEEKEDGVYIEVSVDAPQVADYTFTLTPTDDMYAGIMGIGGAPIMGDEKGAPVSGTNQNTPVVQNAMFSVSEVPMGDVEPSDKHFNVYLTVKSGK